MLLLFVKVWFSQLLKTQNQFYFLSSAWAYDDDVRRVYATLRFYFKTIIPRRVKPVPVSDEIAFEAIKTSLDSVPPGAKMIINSGKWTSHDRINFSLKVHECRIENRRILWHKSAGG